MIKKIIAITLLLSSGSVFAIDWCAGDVDGYLKPVRVCSYNTITTNIRTQCNYSGKLWGDLGGIITSEVVTYPGHSACDSTLNVDLGQVCAYIDPTPHTPPPLGDIETPVYTCDVYTGDINLRSQQFLSDVTQEEVPGSCHTEMEWISCH